MTSQAGKSDVPEAVTEEIWTGVDFGTQAEKSDEDDGSVVVVSRGKCGPWTNRYRGPVLQMMI